MTSSDILDPNPPAYIVTAYWNKARRETAAQLQRDLGDCGLDAQQIPGVQADCRHLAVGCGVDMDNGIACRVAQAHVNALLAFLKTEQPIGLLFEDDVRLTDKDLFQRQLGEFRKVYGQNPAIRALGVFHDPLPTWGARLQPLGTQPKVREWVAVRRLPTGAMTTIFTRAAAASILTRLIPFDGTPLDRVTDWGVKVHGAYLCPMNGSAFSIEILPSEILVQGENDKVTGEAPSTDLLKGDSDG